MNDRHQAISASSVLRAVAVGGLVASVLDGIDAIVAFKAVLGFGPVSIYQFVASGLLGPSAYAGGLGTAALGLGIHCVIGFSAAAAFVAASLKVPRLREQPAFWGALFGVGLYLFMSYVVMPLSLTGASPFSWPLFLNGVVGHALFVGLPIAFAARAFLAPKDLFTAELAGSAA